jgi:hypothetical protein
MAPKRAGSGESLATEPHRSGAKGVFDRPRPDGGDRDSDRPPETTKFEMRAEAMPSLVPVGEGEPGAGEAQALALAAIRPAQVDREVVQRLIEGVKLL